MVIQQEQDLPKHCCVIWRKAVSAQQLGNLEYAVQLLQGLLKQYPEFLSGRQLLRQVGILKLCGEKKGMRTRWRILFFLFKAWWMRQKKSVFALVALERVLEYDPFNRYANWWLYLSALAYGMPETAGFALETLLKGHADDVKVLHQLAEHYVLGGNPQKAVEIYDQILGIAPGDPLAIRARKNAVAQVSLCDTGWNQEATTYKDLIKKTKKS